jgi:hypothetical protein
MAHFKFKLIVHGTVAEGSSCPPEDQMVVASNPAGVRGFSNLYNVFM